MELNQNSHRLIKKTSRLYYIKTQYGYIVETEMCQLYGMEFAMKFVIQLSIQKNWHLQKLPIPKKNIIRVS